MSTRPAPLRASRASAPAGPHPHASADSPPPAPAAPPFRAPAGSHPHAARLSAPARPRAPRLAALSALAAALFTAGCPVPDLFAPDTPPRIEPPPAVTGPILNEPPAPRPRLRVLWRGHVPPEQGPWMQLPDGTAMSNNVVALLGVDSAHRRAFFTRDP